MSTPITRFSSFAIVLHENTLNTLIDGFRVQAPRIFNYATPDIFAAIIKDIRESTDGVGTLACDLGPIRANAARRRPLPLNSLFTPVQYLPIPGSQGLQGISYIFQVGRIAFDFHPNTAFRIPFQVADQFTEQSLALRLSICMGIACLDKKYLDDFLENIPPPRLPPDKDKPPKDKPKDEPPKDKPKDEPPRDGPPLDEPFPFTNIDCFCLDVVAVGRLKRRPQSREHEPNEEYLCIELTGIEIVDIEPEGMENSLECLLYLVLNFGVLPRLRMMIADLRFGKVPLSVIMSPVSDDLPNNPAVENDRLFVFLDLN